jgi:molybdopterin/thiamine biosynthesis adenylyltransferase
MFFDHKRNWLLEHIDNYIVSVYNYLILNQYTMIATWKEPDNNDDSINLGNGEETAPAYIDTSRSKDLNRYLGFNLENIGDVKVAICGTGATGSYVALNLVTNGVRNFLLADNDTVDHSNVSGQNFFNRDVGVNKAEATARNISGKGKNLFIETETDGVNAGNIKQIVEEHDVVYDCIDIEALDMIYLLHVEAHRQKKAVISTYDIGTVAFTATYRYDLAPEGSLPLDGKITHETVERFLSVKAAYKNGEISKREFHVFLHGLYTGPVPFEIIPFEYLKYMVDTLGNRQNKDAVTSQLPETAMMLGGQGAMALKKILGDIKPAVIDKKVPMQTGQGKHIVEGSKKPNFLEVINYKLKAARLLTREVDLIEKKVKDAIVRRIKKPNTMETGNYINTQVGTYGSRVGGRTNEAYKNNSKLIQEQ